MVVRIVPKNLVIGNEQSEGYKILHQASWLPFFYKISGHNIDVTRQFVETFDGSKAQVGNLKLSITEEFISQVIGLPQDGEKWFKK